VWYDDDDAAIPKRVKLKIEVLALPPASLLALTPEDAAFIDQAVHNGVPRESAEGHVRAARYERATLQGEVIPAGTQCVVRAHDHEGGRRRNPLPSVLLYVESPQGQYGFVRWADVSPVWMFPGAC
jgi:hypothetical protein